jgi:hypothetical protein
MDTKTYWIKFNNRDYKNNPNLVIDMLTDARIEEIQEEVMKTYKELHDIMTERYNFVVDLLDEEQRRTLHEWYVDTGVLREE